MIKEALIKALAPLIELNLITEVWDREEWLWIDEPPPERDSDLGIGRYYAWQTPYTERP